MIEPEERRKLLAVPLCGRRVLLRLESIGIRRLSDLAGRDPWDVMHEVNLQAGRPVWHAPMAILALQNLIDAAEGKACRPARPGRHGTLTPAG